MNKPTASQFFIGYGVVWLLVLIMIGYFHPWTGRMALSIFFLKMSAINIGFAILNLIGACVGMSTGFYPWRS